MERSDSGVWYEQILLYDMQEILGTESTVVSTDTRRG